MRSAISSAALLVKVMASTDSGATPWACTRWAMRTVRVRVLPVPGPAEMISGRSVHSTAARCSSLRRANQAASSVTGSGRSNRVSGVHASDRAAAGFASRGRVPPIVSAIAWFTSGGAMSTRRLPLDREEPFLPFAICVLCQRLDHAVLAVVATLRQHLTAPHAANAFGDASPAHGCDLFQRRILQNDEFRAQRIQQREVRRAPPCAYSARRRAPRPESPAGE